MSDVLDVLDPPVGVDPDPDEFIQAAMHWHFGPDTGSVFWLERAKSFEFDPRQDIKSIHDLSLFPNVVNELREVRIEDLIPREYQGQADVVGVYESGGTTGAPKRVPWLRDWMQRSISWFSERLDAHGVPHDTNWLGLVPSGPHGVGSLVAELARLRGGVMFAVDLDPRWVKKLLAAGKAAEAQAYAEHLVEHPGYVLRSQDVGVIMTTPPILGRLADHDELVELINAKVRALLWNGAHLDADTRELLGSEVFPNPRLIGGYGSTMILGSTVERVGLTGADPCVFDTPAPFVTFSVVDPDTLQPVDYGHRGQVVMNHLSKSLLVPNNLERDEATRIPAPPGQAGDSVADVTPLRSFQDADVIEGVY